MPGGCLGACWSFDLTDKAAIISNDFTRGQRHFTSNLLQGYMPWSLFSLRVFSDVAHRRILPMFVVCHKVNFKLLKWPFCVWSKDSIPFTPAGAAKTSSGSCVKWVTSECVPCEVTNFIKALSRQIYQLQRVLWSMNCCFPVCKNSRQGFIQSEVRPPPIITNSHKHALWQL